ncbi:hypothetical protein XENTR_v10016703 [Xenopus tropicalis]|nr:hypothetical protein XENTR_v10016703 [Xenopus tropicalis]
MEDTDNAAAQSPSRNPLARQTMERRDNSDIKDINGRNKKLKKMKDEQGRLGHDRGESRWRHECSQMPKRKEQSTKHEQRPQYRKLTIANRKEESNFFIRDLA